MVVSNWNAIYNYMTHEICFFFFFIFIIMVIITWLMHLRSRKVNANVQILTTITFIYLRGKTSFKNSNKYLNAWNISLFWIHFCWNNGPLLNGVLLKFAVCFGVFISHWNRQNNLAHTDSFLNSTKNHFSVIEEKCLKHNCDVDYPH